MKFSPNSFVDILDYWAEKLPEKNAYIYLSDGETKEETVTFSELRQKALIFATNLRNKTGQNERVLILNPPGIDFIISFLGCLYAGNIPIPLYPPDKHSLSRMISISRDCNASMALANSQIIEKFDTNQSLDNDSLQNKSKEFYEFVDVLEQLNIIDSGLLQFGDINTLNYSRPERNQTAFLQYTSGSTSHPKGVMVSHYNLVKNSELINRYFQHDTNHIKVSWLPPFHDMGLIGEVLQSLYSGMTMVFMSPNAFLKKPFRWLKAITNYKHLGLITTGSPNFGYDFCTDNISDEQIAQLDLSRWKIAYNAAEPVRASTLNRFINKFSVCGFNPTSLYPGYGLAENTLIVSFSEKPRVPLISNFDATLLKSNIARESDEESNKIVSIPSCGNIIDGQRVVIVEPNNNIECPEGHIGEIWIKGESVALGYWNNPEETLKTFQAKISDTGEGPFLRTGDLGFLYCKNLYITGRVKDMIIICGQNHYPQDIEVTVEESHEAIRSSGGAAFSIEHNDNEKLVIVYELKRKYYKTVNHDEIRNCIRNAVFKKHGIDVFDIVFIEQSSFPKTSSGKLQRQLSKKQYLEGSLQVIKVDNIVT